MTNRAVGVIIAGFLTVFIAFAVRYAYGLILPYMLSDLAISKTEAGVIFSSYFITYTLLAPLFGLLVDRSDAKIILAVFVAILGIGTYLMSFFNTVIQASLFYALVGIGHSACWAPVVTVVMRWVSEKRRGIILSIVDLGSTSGVAVCSIMIPFIVTGFSWRAVWVILGVTAIIVACMDFFLIRSHPPDQLGNPGPDMKPKTQVPIAEAYKAIFRDSKFYLIGFSYLLISFSILIPFTFLTTYATQELMISYASATALVAVIAVAGAIGKLILGHFSDKFGRIKIMMLCGLLTACGSLGMAYGHRFAVLFVFSVIFGVGFGTLWPIYAASARDIFPKDYSGSIIGLWTLYHGLGSVLSPVISGWTIDATGTYVWAFILAMIGSVLSLLLLLPLVKMDRRNNRPSQ
ncbi:MAG: MFS transporter [Deltaproteobacteria bacterium]|nr:MFS transporter [Deltaproteobacteria bacterium]